MRAALLAACLVLLAPTALAGSRDAPELTDAPGDCAFPHGNEYADIVAAWISDETAMDFVTNIQLAKWTEQLAAFTGYTLQFTHQGVQWGVAALYDPSSGGWEFTTGQINVETGEMGSFNDTQGSFDASTATLAIAFPKAIFPHDGNDDQLQGFAGGTADFKKDIPIFIAQGLGAPVPTGDFMICDHVESSATYKFTVGQHAAHGATATTEESETEEPTAVAEAGTVASSPAPGSAPENETPGAPVAFLLAALVAIALARRVSPK